MARAGQARAGGHTQPPVLLLALLLACCVGCLARHGAEGGGSGGDVDRATVRAARGLQSAASPSPGPATLTVSKGTGSSVSIGMVVGIAVAGGVVVGIAVGLYIAYRFHVSRRSRHTALAIPSEDVDAAEHGGAARREAFITSRDTGRAVWDLHQQGHLRGGRSDSWHPRRADDARHGCTAAVVRVMIPRLHRPASVLLLSYCSRIRRQVQLIHTLAHWHPVDVPPSRVFLSPVHPVILSTRVAVRHSPAAPSSLPLPTVCS